MNGNGYLKEVILLKSGEIALKGLNRSTFEDLLIKNVRRRLSPLGQWEYRRAQSTTYITPLGEDNDIDEAMERVARVFGVAAYCRAGVAEKDFNAIRAAAPDYLRPALESAGTFKVEAKRSDKGFPMQSPEICRELGGELSARFPHLRVDVVRPDVTVFVEIREAAAYLHAGKETGAGGIPVGSSGRAMLLVSGGIDSPVAGWMMAKRGVELNAVHFESPPYTSERAREKVIALLEKLAPWCGRMKCHIVPFTRIQEEIRDRCPEEYFTLVMRRYMMRIADTIARGCGCGALITGESLGQVASQTMLALGCTDPAAQLPVLRPVVGMDKLEIVRIARRIDTFETSILPYEDCCTVFTPRHPRTRPRLATVEEIERRTDVDGLTREAVDGARDLWIQ